MKLYYTGSDSFNGVQTDSKSSLGGFISSTPIPNQKIGNLFSDISYNNLIKKPIEIIGIALKNELANKIDLKIWIEKLSGGICNYQIALVAPTVQGSNLSLEKISTKDSYPYYASFINAISEGTAFYQATFNLNEYLGIWIKREITSDGLELYENDSLKELGLNPIFDIQEKFNLHIKYT